MDRFLRDRIVMGPVGRRVSTLLLLALLLVEAGCHREKRAGPPIPPPAPVSGERAGDTTVPATVPAGFHPAVAVDGAEKEAGAPSVDTTPPDVTLPDATEAGGPEAVAPAASPLPKAERGSDVPTRPDTTGQPEPSPSARKPKPAVAPLPASAPNDIPASSVPDSAKSPEEPVLASASKDSPAASVPGWAKSPEELAYRVDFIGITMGYARFRYQGKVSIAGKPAYHLNVRAWTSGVLSYIYPINDTIDYYLDAETLAPIRQEFTHPEREKDDVALYDQETGKITYRYRESGEIRKQVTTIPSVYDPVSVAYYFRWKDLGLENRPRNVYGGRKLYQISSRILGNERIRTEHGDVETIAVVPLIRRDGKPDDKGDLKIWFSNDERRVPVRLYAKFRKIKDWTLVGELMPPAGKAGR